jgi:hypothetical protein
MPRSTIAQRQFKALDSLLELALYSANTVAATGFGATVVFLPAVKLLGFKAIFNVAAYTGYVAGTAQWALSLQFADDAAFTVNPITVGSVIAVGVATSLELGLTGRQLEAISLNTSYVRFVATKVGAPGNLQFGAFLTPSV